ncbi:MAG: hypothetical protein PVSMB4_10530 [Ktedonobacterales bacterium]
MSTPEPGHTAATAPVATPPAPTRGGGQLGRRVLLTTVVGAGLCAGGAALTPLALDKAKQYATDQFTAGLEAGANQARQQLLNELEQLEGISLDAALQVAHFTRLAVQYIVLPVANAVAAIGAGALDLLISAIDAVRSGLSYIPGGSQFAPPLDRLRDMLGSWRTGVKLLPIELTAYANTDIDSAQTYLTSLQAKIAAERAKSAAAPSPTVGSGY